MYDSPVDPRILGDDLEGHSHGRMEVQNSTDTVVFPERLIWTSPNRHGSCVHPVYLVEIGTACSAEPYDDHGLHERCQNPLEPRSRRGAAR